MKDYAILRILMKGANETHSIEYKDTLREANARWHNILAADDGNAQTTYCQCTIFDRFMNKIKSEIHDYRPEGEQTAFYPMIRITEDADPEEGANPMHNSVQIYYDDPQNPGQAYVEADKRYWMVWGTDINDSSLVYNAAVLMDNNGMTGDYHRAHENPTPESEP